MAGGSPQRQVLTVTGVAGATYTITLPAGATNSF